MNVKRTPSDQRAFEAEQRARFRQDRMAALDNDAKKAQVVIAQVKGLSSSSLDGMLSADESADCTNQQTTINFLLIQMMQRSLVCYKHFKFIIKRQKDKNLK